jgi:hypothetical protein
LLCSWEVNDTWANVWNRLERLLSIFKYRIFKTKIRSFSVLESIKLDSSLIIRPI